MKTTILQLTLVLSLILGSSCVKDNFDTIYEEGGITAEEGAVEPKELTELDVPESFDFSTERAVTLDITDAQNGVRYTVLNEGQTVHNAMVVNGGLNGQFMLPTTTTSITLLRRTGTVLHEIVLPVNGDRISYTN